MMLRSSILLAHRWSGLATAMIVFLAASTGGVLAIYSQLDRWLAPEFYLEGRAGFSVDPFELREAARGRFPDATFDVLDLMHGPGAWSLNADVLVHGQPVRRELAFDPTTGSLIATRDAHAWPSSASEVMPFIHHLHARLALPGVIGIWILGITAIVWTLNCFISAYLTMPTRRRAFFRLWKPSWKVKKDASGLRLHFDLHRALGLWFWGATLLFAWSSVYQMLTHQVYEPVMRSLGFEFVVGDDRRQGGAVLEDTAEPALSFRNAAALALKAAHEDAVQQNYVVEGLHSIYLQRHRGVFEVLISSSRDIGRVPETFVHVDATHGTVLGITFLRSATGDSASTWLGAVHTARLGGSALYPSIVLLIGVVVAGVVLTGFVIWLKRRPKKPVPSKAGQAN